MAVLDGTTSNSFLRWACRPAKPVVMATLLTGILSLAWALWLAHDAGDLAAQYAWTAFVRMHPGSAYDLSWYGGIHPASYSVISPYLMAWIGVRTTGVAAATISAALGAVILSRSGVRRPDVASLWLAVAVWCNVVSGRVTYLLGMMFALLAVVLIQDGADRRPRPVIAAVFGVIATMSSPVAGLFIEVLAAALFLAGRRSHAYLLAVGPPLVIGTTSLLFPFYGVQPFPWYSALPTLGIGIAVALLVPRAWRTVRAGAWIYVLGVGLSWMLPTPIGSNVERLALLAGATVLICAAMAADRAGRRTIAYLAAAAMATWMVVAPIADVINTAPATAITADARPLIAELKNLHADQGRVEVVPLRSHWEASSIAPYVDLARGWNRQVDVARNPLFYDGTLTAASYHEWLREWSVGFLVLPADQLDNAGVAEARIITTGHPWLHRIWENADWRIYRVDGVDPLAAAPAKVTHAGPAALTVDMPQPGSVMLRIAWSPWLGIDGVRDNGTAHACLAQEGTWTELTTPTAGMFTIAARYTFDRGTPCSLAPDDR